MIIRKVIDAGGLRSRELGNFLSRSNRHYAVITDYTTLEMFYGNPQINLRRSLEILSRFPGQVIVLKSNARIWKMMPHSEGLQSRLQDRKKTQAFPRYCQALFSGDEIRAKRMAASISTFGGEAQASGQRLMQLSVPFRTVIKDLESTILPGDLRAIRDLKQASQESYARAARDILESTALFFHEVLRTDPIPDLRQIIFSMPFRYAVCHYVVSLKWVLQKGYIEASEKTLRNDEVDTVHAAYATFFDGLITQDKRLQAVYSASRWILRRLFGLPMN